MANWGISVVMVQEEGCFKPNDQIHLRVTVTCEKKTRVPKLSATLTSVETRTDRPLVTGWVSGLMSSDKKTVESLLESRVIRERSREEAGFSETYSVQLQIPLTLIFLLLYFQPLQLP